MRLLLIAVFLFAFQAKAGIYIEPYAGYMSSNYKVKLAGQYQGTDFTSDSTDSDSAVAFGGKLGYAIPFMAIGGDYTMAGDVTDIGPFAEFRLPFFLKFRATYILSSQTKESDNDLKFKGSGIKAGLAFSLFANITLNLDYISVKYDKQVGSDADWEFSKIDIQRTAYLASLGFPFDF